ncbi:MAG: HNH endonuclease [Desulfobacterium sp.]|nr:HNH endonuclease [Desulfobacterium sp.]
MKTDRGKHRWSSLTCHGAPHKPLLLLSLMDGFAQGLLVEPFIVPSQALLETFNQYWSRIMPRGKTTSMAYPFPRLKSDGFWERVPHPGYDPVTDYNVSSMVQLRKIYAGARMDQELFTLFCLPETRERLRGVLINTYFAPEIRPLLVEQGHVNQAAYDYSQTLLKIAESQGLFETETDRHKKVRDQGFRKAIVTLYDHRCALCGIKLLTPEGHTIVDAAHIVPWSRSHDDRPVNGLCLCKLCHWSFDEGLMGVSKNYEVLVSKKAGFDSNMPGHIFTLTDRPIFKPDKERFWPEQASLAWHRKEKFS